MRSNNSTPDKTTRDSAYNRSRTSFMRSSKLYALSTLLSKFSLPIKDVRENNGALKEIFYPETPDEDEEEEEVSKGKY